MQGCANLLRDPDSHLLSEGKLLNTIHLSESPLPTVIGALTMSKRRSLRCYGNNFCSPESLKSAMIKLPLETLSHLHVSLSLGSRLGNVFQLPCIAEPQICHAEVRRDAFLTRPWAGLGLSAIPTSRERHSSWAGNEAHRSQRKLLQKQKMTIQDMRP